MSAYTFVIITPEPTQNGVLVSVRFLAVWQIIMKISSIGQERSKLNSCMQANIIKAK